MSPGIFKKKSAFGSRRAYLLVILLFIACRISGQMYSESHSRPLIIRSGLKAAIGYSLLHLDDAVMPFFTTSEYFSFTPNLCMKAGAIVTIQPRFLSERFQIVFDPAFTKFSYGGNKEVTHENVVNFVDIDVESLEFPLSLRYSFNTGVHSIQPFIRGGYSYSYFIDSEAYFKSKEWHGDEVTDYQTSEFEYSKFQDAVSVSVGIELNLKLVDYTLELVIEKGDGIHKNKFGDSFLKISNTTSTYLQLGLLF